MKISLYFLEKFVSVFMIMTVFRMSLNGYVNAAALSAINFKQAGKFITALERDDRGRVWIGTEDEGVLVCDPAGDGKLRQFTTTDGLGDDNAYALACDGQGRVWAGNLRHGVSVYNGVFYNQLLRRSIWRRFNMFVSM